jgi:mono/diheme cytochrome c family protein
MRRLIAACLLLGACSPPLAADASGAEIYEARCATCHGIGLEGGLGPALGAGSDVVDKPDTYIVNTINNGRGRMPAFRATLDAAQVDRVVEYLRLEQAK